uniref:t-SNARE coiled-coil homology domain-containing protein n=1 Tax=Cannabis sativa TaxID=3483 RepID=A0A803PRT6_CANSA
MASSSDSWMKEYNEAVKLADDINGMISERSSLPGSGPEMQRHASAIRRKITILGTRLDSLQSVLSKLPGKQPMSKLSQMASTLNMSNFANRDSLLGPEIKPADAMGKAAGLDNNGLVEQDEGLEKLEETVISTKHIALAVNEELDLHTRLIDDLDYHVDVTDSRLRLYMYKIKFEKPDEVYFYFAKKRCRFSRVEFALVTGLNLLPESTEQEIEEKENSNQFIVKYFNSE